jgi:hypothetical protein
MKSSNTNIFPKLGSARIGGGKRRSKVVVLGCTRRRKMRVFEWDFGQIMDKTKWG